MPAFNKTYLHILRQQHPLLYKLCCCVLFIYIFLNAVRVEVPPFFLSMMYSVPITNSDTQYVYDFEYNDRQQWKAHSYLQHHRRITFYYTIDFYHQCISGDSIQAADGQKLKSMFPDHHFMTTYLDKVYAQKHDILAYPQWLKDYMESIICTPIDKYLVTKKHIAFQGHHTTVFHIDTVINFNYD